MYKEAVVAYSEILSSHLNEGTKKNMYNLDQESRVPTSPPRMQIRSITALTSLLAQVPI
jgi:hypothetical protein